nr:MAG: LSU ribosomal protein L18P [Candidatus Nanosalinarum sp. J07AB56]
MSDGPNYEVPERRRREQATDYEQRLKLLKSGKPRAVTRTSNRHTRVHLSAFNREGDENAAQTVSKELREYGWEHSTSSIPAAYLTGLLAGHRTDVEEAVLDTGTREVKHGSRHFAAAQGLRDAGVDVPVGESAVPDRSRIRGEHIEEVTGEDVVDNLEETKEEIEDA